MTRLVGAQGALSDAAAAPLAVRATSSARRSSPLPRSLHPWAWWTWAACCAVVATLTRNVLLEVLLAVSLWFVVCRRRTHAGVGRARAALLYVWLALMVIGIRVVFMVLLGGLRTGHVLVDLPQLSLPAWLAGITVGGPVTVEALLFALTDGGRLAVLLCCVGAANVLAHPRRALKTVPHAWHRIATAVVIALAVAPQLAEATERVRRAQRLRGGAMPRRRRGWHAANRVVVPVLEDAVEGSLSLAASMESRGFGRSSRPTHHRPDPWRAPETLVVACGLSAASLTGWLRHASHADIWPPVSPLAWPTLTIPMLVVVLLVVAPGVITPPPAQDAP